MNASAIFLIGIYKKFISPLIPGRCRFYPSCSEYAVQCFSHYGFLKALGKSAYRILRCNPFSKGYFDPAVPEEKADPGN